MSQTAHTNGSAIAHAAGKPITYEVPGELQKILERADKKDSTGESKELRALLAGELLLSKLSPEHMAVKGRMEQAILMAEGVAFLRGVLTDALMKQYFVPLMNTQLGFKTDRPAKFISNKTKEEDKFPYPVDVVRECLIVALLHGAFPVNNEFNIISGNAYFTKAFFSRKLAEFPSLTDLRISYDVPEFAYAGEDVVGAKVGFSASWVINGKADHLAGTIPVKANNYQGADATLGKADRKIKARIYGRLTGSEFTTDGEIDDAPAANGAVSTTAPASKHSNPNEAANQALDKLKQQTALQADQPTPTGAPPVNAPASAPATTTNTTEQHSESDQGDAPSEAAAGTGRTDKTTEPVDDAEQEFLASLRR